MGPNRREAQVQSRVVIERGGIGDARDRWPEIQDRMIDRMQALCNAFKPHISKLRL